MNGNALCCDKVFADEQEKVTALRDRQTRFLATLPAEPQAALDASFSILNPDFGDYIEGFEEALHLSQVLASVIKWGDLEEDSRELEAAEFVSQQVADHLHRTRSQLDYLSHILGNPRRLEREVNSNGRATISS
ncbi:hypothetical protein NBRC116598_04210 [Pseudophaeobacter arcticus]|uniref:Uncharacterized protein n=1 Tax=Pseudophaeobacter arcticus TaxID=385492 RepID=A0ABQ0AGH0_9RHOB